MLVEELRKDPNTCIEALENQVHNARNLDKKLIQSLWNVVMNWRQIPLDKRDEKLSHRMFQLSQRISQISSMDEGRELSRLVNNISQTILLRSPRVEDFLEAGIPGFKNNPQKTITSLYQWKLNRYVANLDLRYLELPDRLKMLKQLMSLSNDCALNCMKYPEKFGLTQLALERYLPFIKETLIESGEYPVGLLLKHFTIGDIDEVDEEYVFTVFKELIFEDNRYINDALIGNFTKIGLNQLHLRQRLDLCIALAKSSHVRVGFMVEEFEKFGFVEDIRGFEDFNDRLALSEKIVELGKWAAQGIANHLEELGLEALDFDKRIAHCQKIHLEGGRISINAFKKIGFLKDITQIKDPTKRLEFCKNFAEKYQWAVSLMAKIFWELGLDEVDVKECFSLCKILVLGEDDAIYHLLDNYDSFKLETANVADLMDFFLLIISQPNENMDLIAEVLLPLLPEKATMKQCLDLYYKMMKSGDNGGVGLAWQFDKLRLEEMTPAERFDLLMAIIRSGPDAANSLVPHLNKFDVGNFLDLFLLYTEAALQSASSASDLVEIEDLKLEYATFEQRRTFLRAIISHAFGTYSLFKQLNKIHLSIKEKRQLVCELLIPPNYCLDRWFQDIAFMCDLQPVTSLLLLKERYSYASEVEAFESFLQKNPNCSPLQSIFNQIKEQSDQQGLLLLYQWVAYCAGVMVDMDKKNIQAIEESGLLEEIYHLRNPSNRFTFVRHMTQLTDDELKQLPDGDVKLISVLLTRMSQLGFPEAYVTSILKEINETKQINELVQLLLVIIEKEPYEDEETQVIADRILKVFCTKDFECSGKKIKRISSELKILTKLLTLFGKKTFIQCVKSEGNLDFLFKKVFQKFFEVGAIDSLINRYETTLRQYRDTMDLLTCCCIGAADICFQNRNQSDATKYLQKAHCYLLHTLQQDRSISKSDYKFFLNKIIDKFSEMNDPLNAAICYEEFMNVPTVESPCCLKEECNDYWGKAFAQAFGRCWLLVPKIFSFESIFFSKPLEQRKYFLQLLSFFDRLKKGELLPVKVSEFQIVLDEIANPEKYLKANYKKLKAFFLGFPKEVRFSPEVSITLIKLMKHRTFVSNAELEFFEQIKTDRRLITEWLLFITPFSQMTSINFYFGGEIFRKLESIRVICQSIDKKIEKKAFELIQDRIKRWEIEIDLSKTELLTLAKKARLSTALIRSLFPMESINAIIKPLRTSEKPFKNLISQLLFAVELIPELLDSDVPIATKQIVELTNQFFQYKNDEESAQLLKTVISKVFERLNQKSPWVLNTFKTSQQPELLALAFSQEVLRCLPEGVLEGSQTVEDIVVKFCQSPRFVELMETLTCLFLPRDAIVLTYFLLKREIMTFSLNVILAQFPSNKKGNSETLELYFLLLSFLGPKFIENKIIQLFNILCSIPRIERRERVYNIIGVWEDLRDLYEEEEVLDLLKQPFNRVFKLKESFRMTIEREEFSKPEKLLLKLRAIIAISNRFPNRISDGESMVVDLGGVTRDRFSRLFAALFRFPNSGIKCIREELGIIPKTSSTNDKYYEAIGMLFGLVLREPEENCVGKHFHPVLFKMLYSLDNTDINVIKNASLSITPPSPELSKIQDKLLKCYIEHSTFSCMFHEDEKIDLVTCLDQFILMNQIPNSLQDLEIHTKEQFMLEYGIDQVLMAVFVLTKGINYFIPSAKWNEIKGTSFEVLAKKTQGSLDKKEIVLSLKFFNYCDKTSKFLIDWINQAKEEELEQLIQAITGSSSLPFGSKIEIFYVSGSEKRFPSFSTCSFRINLPTGYATYELFKSRLETAIKNALHGFTMA